MLHSPVNADRLRRWTDQLKLLPQDRARHQTCTQLRVGMEHLQGQQWAWGTARQHSFHGHFAPNACWLPQTHPSRMSCTIAPFQQQRVRVDFAVALGSRRLPAGTYAVSNIRWGRDVAGSFTFSMLGPAG